MEEKTIHLSNKKTKIWFLAIIVILVLVLGVFLLIFVTRQKPVPPLLSVPIQEEELLISEDFEEAVAQLDTSEKLVEFINENFIFETKEGSIALSPQEFFEKKKGSIQDFAVFCAYVLDYHQYEAGIIRYQFIVDNKPSINTVVVFRDTDLPKYIYFDDKKTNLVHYGSSFEELFQAEEKRLDIEITQFTVFYPNVFGLTPAENWIER